MKTAVQVFIFFSAILPLVALAERGVKCTLKDGTILRQQVTCYGKNAIREESETRTPAERKADADALLARRTALETAEPVIGMTKEQALELQSPCWGRPKSVNKTVSVHGEREQWVYRCNGYLYFDNGILTTIQK